MWDISRSDFFSRNPLNDVDQNIFNRNRIVVSRTEWVSDNDLYGVMSWMERVVREVWLILSIEEASDLFENLPEYATIKYPESFLLHTDLWYWAQINSAALHSFVSERNKLQSNPQLECVLVSRDLSEYDITKPDWIYGSSSYPIHIISTARWSFEDSPTERKKALEIVGAHELCHSYGLVIRDFNMWVNGLETYHCMWEVWPCIMEQVEIWRKTLKQMMSEVQQRTHLLCSDCSTEIQAKLAFLRKQWLQI